MLLSTFKCTTMFLPKYVEQAKSHSLHILAASPAGPSRLQFGTTKTMLLSLTDELRARIQTYDYDPDLGVLEFLNQDGCLNPNPREVEVFGYEGVRIKICGGQHLISWAQEYTIKVEGGRSYSLVPSKITYVKEI